MLVSVLALSPDPLGVCMVEVTWPACCFCGDGWSCCCEVLGDFSQGSGGAVLERFIPLQP